MKDNDAIQQVAVVTGDAFKCLAAMIVNDLVEKLPVVSVVRCNGTKCRLK